MSQKTTVDWIVMAPAWSWTQILILLLILSPSFNFVAAAQSTDSQSDGQLVESANSLLKEGKLDDAWKTANQAIQAQPANYLAYAVAAKIASKQGNSSQATTFVNKALELAPAEAKDKVRQLAAMLSTSASVPDSSGSALSDDDQIKHDGLMRVVENAMKADDSEERKSLYQRFLAQSGEFADAHPDQVDIWVARAYAAVALDHPAEGWQAGKRLKLLRATHRDDEKIREELVDLESKGWLSDYVPAVSTADLTEPSKFTEKAPDSFKVRFDTTKGSFTVEVTRALAPKGADRFYNLVKNGFFKDIAFFRVVPGFMVQFGIHGDPKVAAAWHGANIPDDPVKSSNMRGTITFASAGPNSRTTQLFINYANNTFLDPHFPPFGEVIDGMDVVGTINSESGERPNQMLIQDQGNAYLKKEFPNLDYIKLATISH